MKFTLMATMAVVILGIDVTQNAWAFRLTPMVSELRPSGARATQTFTVENTGKDKLAVQLEIFTREIAQDGQETRNPSQDLNIYPDQISLEPGAKRNIKVTWVSSPKPPTELAYRLVATQLPVEFKDKNAAKKAGVNLQFLLQYVASVYVTPEQVSAQVIVENTELTGAGKLKISFKNKGTAHQLLRGAHLTVNGVAVPESSLKEMDTENILPGGVRVFEIPAPAQLKAGKIQADVRFDSL